MKILKWIGIVLGVLILIGIVGIIILNIMANKRLNKTYEVNAEQIELPTDSASLAYGEHLANVLCKECHGGLLEGKLFFDEPKLAVVYTPNLTSGEGGIGGAYTDADWVRSIRHGVNSKGKGLFIMPSKDFHRMSEDDLGSLIAYLKTMQPVDNNIGENEYGILGKVLLSLGAFGDVISAETIDHGAGFEAAPSKEVSVAYGDYLAIVTGCKNCHYENLAGGENPDPNGPPIPNLTPAGNLKNWSESDFITAIRTGTTPENKELNDEFMPWPHLAKMTDMELQAIWTYFQTVPAQES